MKRAQSAMEFVILISFMIIVFFSFFLIIQARIVDATQAQDVIFLKEANNMIVSSLTVARQAPTDFKMTFVVEDVGEKTYDIDLYDSVEVVSSYSTLEYVNFLPFEVKGFLNAPEQNNVVYHQDGVVYDGSTFHTDSRAAGIFLNVDAEYCLLEDIKNGCATIVPASEAGVCNTHLGLC